jgi:uncharacterized protein YutE (UPF0331/DUF86 family)
LKQKPSILDKNLQTIWELHKFRNRIAHEIGSINENSLKNEADRFERVIKDIL